MMIETMTIADTARVLPLLNRCVRMDVAKLRELIASERCLAAWVAAEVSVSGAVLLIHDEDDGHIVYLVRELGQGNPAIIDQLMKPVEQCRGGDSSPPMTLVLDGYDAEAAGYFLSRGCQQIDCDHLLSTVISALPTDLAAHPYRPEELALYIRVFDQAFFPLRHANGREPFALWSSRPDWAKQWFESAAARGDMASVWVDDQMVACYRIDGDTIDSVAVVPERQGRGLGRTIINHCINLIQNRGHQRVYLYVAETNPRALRLYEQLGFRSEMISRTMVCYPNE